MAPKKNSGAQTVKRYPPYLLARQIAGLKKLSEDTQTPVQHYIRQAIDEFLQKQKKKQRARRTLQRSKGDNESR